MLNATSYQTNICTTPLLPKHLAHGDLWLAWEFGRKAIGGFFGELVPKGEDQEPQDVSPFHVYDLCLFPDKKPLVIFKSLPLSSLQNSVLL